MHRSAAHFLLAAALLLSLIAAADQNDQRLAPLFETLKSTGDPATARAAEVEIWRIWIDSGDSNIDGLMVEGVVAMNNARLADAITIFGEITERAPAFAEGWNKRATAYFLNENYAASVRDIQTTLALEPRHFGAISGMGLIFLTRGDETGPLAAFEAVVAIHPNSPGARQRIEELRKRVLERGA